MFKIIDENIDNIIGKKYYLCKINLFELITIVKNKMVDIDISSFNRDFLDFNVNDYYETDNETPENKKIRIEAENNVKRYNGITLTSPYIDDGYTRERINYFSNKSKSIENESEHGFIFNYAIENNFISLYSESFNDGKLEGYFYLLDGYRRLLFDFNTIEKNIDKDVYVKIYTNTTEQDIMELMFGFNIWKIPQGIHVWFDRGWRLFIFMHTGIYLSQQHFYLLDEYVGREYINYKTYDAQEKIITSKQFYNDIKIIDYLVNCEKMHHSKGKYFNYEFIEKLGKIRLNGNENYLNVEDWIHFLDLKYEDVDKIKSMTVHGHYNKRIILLVNEFFDMWKNPELIEEMNTEKPKSVSKTVIEDFYWNIPSYVRNEHTISIINDECLYIDCVNYYYENNKLYQYSTYNKYSNKYRVYLIFDKYKVISYDKVYYIINKDMKINYVDLVFHDNYVFKGSKEELIIKIKENTGKTWKPNTRLTEFL
jgi:hypothetical protein